MREIVLAVVIGAVVIAAPSAQEPGIATKQAAEAAEKANLDALTMKVQNLRVSVESRVTKNAPYSAEAVTESVQVLADGNRIVTKSTTRIFRDSEGRTRREQLNQVGTDAVTINISDPVAGTTYVLDPANHLAFRNGLIFTAASGGMAVGTLAPAGRGTVSVARVPEGAMTLVARDGGQKEAAEAEATAAAKMSTDFYARQRGAGGAVFIAEGVLPARVGEAMGNTTREDLGQQTIEGVTATGTRATTEIPAGAIGNDQPIKVVSEQWYSPELQVLVLTKHNDPRSGETTYRLTNVVRAEPVRSQFELPPDYTLKESAIRRDQR
jgi:hypothetical protein